MPPNSRAATPPQLASGFKESKNLAEVATCRALHVGMVAGAEVREEYGSLNPYRSGRPDYVFTMQGASSEWKVAEPGKNPQNLATGLIQKAFNSDGSYCKELDDCIDRVQDEELQQQMRNLLPMAYACHGRAVTQAYEETKRMMFDYGKKHQIIKGRNREGKPFRIDRRARDLARKFKAENL